MTEGNTERACSEVSFDATDWEDADCPDGTCVRNIQVIVVADQCERTSVSVDVKIKYEDADKNIRVDDRTWEYNIYNETSLEKTETTVVFAGEKIVAVDPIAYRCTCYE